MKEKNKQQLKKEAENLSLLNEKGFSAYSKALQIEMSLVPTYEGVLSFEEMTNLLKSKGLSFFSIESGYFDSKSGKLLEVDGVFLLQ